MTKEELAAILNGREYGSEITEAEEVEARAADLVVMFGASDDLVELRGAINDEIGAGDFSLVDGEVYQYEQCDCKHAELADERAAEIGLAFRAEYGKNGWIYETEVPHAAFDVMEDGERYCRGIVFALAKASPSQEEGK